MKKLGLPGIISVSDKLKLSIIKLEISYPESDGKKIFKNIDGCIRKTNYNGKGGENKIEYFDEINKESRPKKENAVSVYQVVSKDRHTEQLGNIIHQILSLTKGDLSKVSLNIDQMEFIVLNNKGFITEISNGKNIFFIESGHKVFPLSINPAPGGFGEVFDTHIENIGDLSHYTCGIRIFVPQF